MTKCKSETVAQLHKRWQH